MIFIWRNVDMKICARMYLKYLEKLNLEYLFYERKMVDIKEIKDQFNE